MRGVRAKKRLLIKQFVCEYEANLLFSEEEVRAAEREYADCPDIYILQVCRDSYLPL